EQGVMLVRHGSHWYFLHGTCPFRAGPAAARIEQTEVLSRIRKHGQRAFLLKKDVELFTERHGFFEVCLWRFILAELFVRRDWRAGRLFDFGDRHKLRRWTVENDFAPELAAKCIQIRTVVGRHDDDLPFHLAAGAGRPSKSSQGKLAAVIGFED